MSSAEVVSFAHLREEWMAQANCKNSPTRWWFPNHGDSGEDVRNRKQAVRMCLMCKVRKDCLQYGIKTSSSGIWGGVTLDRGSNRKLGIRVSNKGL